MTETKIIVKENCGERNFAESGAFKLSLSIEYSLVQK